MPGGYQRVGGVLDDKRLRWHVAVALLLCGKISLLRCLAPDWEARLDVVVDQAEAVLEGRWFETGTGTVLAEVSK